jgi:LysR family transcriptional regulator, nitrogen assimilation regulatory protein
MRIRHLEYFVRVCELESITKAASSMNVAQPALGAQLKSLEEELGAVLLVRTPRGVRLTRAGEILLEDAKHILNRLRETRLKLRHANDQENRTLTLGMTPSLTSVLTGPLLDRLPHDHPSINLQIFEEFSHTLLDRIQRGQLDMALAYSVPAHKSLQRQACLQEELFFVCSPGSPFDRPDPLPFHELEQITFVMPSERDLLRQLVEKTMRRNGLTLRIMYQVESPQAMKDVIARGMACGIQPYGTVAKEAAEKRLIVRPVSPPIMRTLYLVHAADQDETEDRRRLIAIIFDLLQGLCSENSSYQPYQPFQSGMLVRHRIEPR